MSISIYVARYMKHKLGVWWYRLHVFLMVFGTFGCTVFGAVMAFLNTSIHLNGIHQVRARCLVHDPPGFTWHGMHL